MAPVKIKHVVSFTSQDPKYPVENLLLEEAARPWLCSPGDRSRQLRVELQLEQASRIGYVDVGNCGSALLQIDVGRSSWPLDQRYPTLLPATSLMAPAEAKLDKNRSGVRMFKEGDFLASALGEKWDRVRLLCSQPFNKHAQFGLAFIQIRMPVDTESAQADPLRASGEASREPTRRPWLSSAAICRTFFSAVPSSSEEEKALRGQLQQLDPSSSPGGLSPACLSRPARMVLQAASAHRRTFPLLAGSSSPRGGGKREGQDSGAPDPPASGSKQKLCKRRDRVKTNSSRIRGGLCSNVGRSRNNSQEAQSWKRKRRNVEDNEGEVEEKIGAEGEDHPEGEHEGLGTCPICEGRFPASLLASHASGCGEEDGEGDISSSPLSPSPSWWEAPAEAWVACPICQSRFPASEVESHASCCGEPAELSGGSPPWLWVE
ncbi:hypothetical protein JRQ81_019809 [Phrynocephalus forsythii]|uniref:DNA-repair protein Xrcc1 N-terminal domain-containing protein n=1 Tax=Phrynocephalus forsythii TaxID=171643 RepID=A0A9Q0XNN5_9SAUR|nr:hypothetical protein JRQ81_019809 [Phrynocephalus forsythii]